MWIQKKKKKKTTKLRRKTVKSFPLLYFPSLLAQIHSPSCIQIIECIIFQVFYEQDALSGTFHFRPQLLVHIRKLVEAENRLFYGKAIQFWTEFEIGHLVVPQHHFGGVVHIRFAIRF